MVLGSFELQRFEISIHGGSILPQSDQVKGLTTSKLDQPTNKHYVN